MQIAILQPTYPREASPPAAQGCIEWMLERLRSIDPGTCDLVLLPEYANVPGIEGSEAMDLDTGAYVVRSSYAMESGTGGRSLLASPEGRILADVGAEPGVLRCEIDPKEKYVKPASHGQPLVEHSALLRSRRRPCLYRPYPDREEGLLSRPSPRLCAHRGLSEVCPENTLPAFGAALALGVEEMELDLWMSRDGVPVVCHDADVGRTTDGAGKITEMDWKTLRRLDAGISHAEAWRGVRLPRFEQVLDLVDGRTGLNIHIKEPGPDDRLVQLVCDLIRERGERGLHYVAGAEDVLSAARQYSPEIARACLAAQNDATKQIQLAGEYGCERIQFGRQVKEDALREARDKGFICNLFWSDDLEDALTYVEMGIQVILTNAAHRLVGLG